MNLPWILLLTLVLHAYGVWHFFNKKNFKWACICAFSEGAQVMAMFTYLVKTYGV